MSRFDPGTDPSPKKQLSNSDFRSILFMNPGGINIC